MSILLSLPQQAFYHIQHCAVSCLLPVIALKVMSIAMVVSVGGGGGPNSGVAAAAIPLSTKVTNSVTQI